MHLTGIICEYNPFHTGHAYQLDAARDDTGADAAIVCVMGGNFVQRGEPAVVNKHARARMAVKCGADLVVELPVPWAIASAERFAAGGVAILEALGADSIAFGAECADVERLMRVAAALLSNEAGVIIGRLLLTGLSYASARQRAMEELIGEDAALLRQPNNILAIEYLKSLIRRGSSISPVAVPRFGPGHDGGESGGMASASHIRHTLLSGGDASPFMPPAAYDILCRELEAGRGPVMPMALEQAQLYRLRTMSMGDIAALPDCTEGLDRRIYAAVRRAPSLEGVIAAVKTKRYAHSRLRRMALAALLGVEASHQLSDPPYLRLLAIGPRGRQALRQIRQTSPLPIITKPASAKLLPPEARGVFELEARAGDIYALAYPRAEARAPGADWLVSPAVEE